MPINIFCFKVNIKAHHNYSSIVRHKIVHVNRNRNRNLQTSKAPLKSQAQGTMQLIHELCVKSEGFPKNSPWEAQVRLPEGERREIRR